MSVAWSNLRLTLRSSSISSTGVVKTSDGWMRAALCHTNPNGPSLSILVRVLRRLCTSLKSVGKVVTATDRPTALAAASTSAFSFARRSALRAHRAILSKCFWAKSFAVVMPMPGLIPHSVFVNQTEGGGREDYLPTPEEDEDW